MSCTGTSAAARNTHIAINMAAGQDRSLKEAGRILSDSGCAGAHAHSMQAAPLRQFDWPVSSVSSPEYLPHLSGKSIVPEKQQPGRPGLLITKDLLCGL